MNDHTGKPPGDGGPPDNLGDDLLQGAAAIAEFLFGDARKRRKVFHLVAKTKIPVFRLGTMICARRRVLLSYIDEQERRVPSSVNGHPRRKGKPDEPMPTPACPPPHPRGPAPASAASAGDRNG